MYKVLDEFSLEHLEGVVNVELNPVTYLSIDPGKSNGVCGYDPTYRVQFMFVVPAEHINKFLKAFHCVKKVIIEDYKLYPHKLKQQVYSDMETSRVIGRVESWTEDNNIQLIKQGASIKPVGYAWIGKKPLPKSNPNGHALDAHVHFMYWAVKSHKINAADLLVGEGELLKDAKPLSE